MPFILASAPTLAGDPTLSKDINLYFHGDTGLNPGSNGIVTDHDHDAEASLGGASAHPVYHDDPAQHATPLSSITHELPVSDLVLEHDIPVAEAYIGETEEFKNDS